MTITPTTVDTDTELSAVNSILGAIGQSPVTTLGSVTEIQGELNYTGSNARAGTYGRSGTTVTVTSNSHGLTVGEVVTIDFTSGGALDGEYTIVTVADANTFTVTTVASEPDIVAGQSLTISQTKFSLTGLSWTLESEIKTKIAGDVETGFSVSGSTLTFTTAPATDATVKIYREKEVYNTLANPEVSFIYNILTEVNKDVQNEGWIFNIERHVKKTPETGTNYITIPANILRYDLNEAQAHHTSDLVRRKYEGAFRLYDTVNHTYEFSNALDLDIVWLFPYEDIPPVFKRYIISKASVRAATQLVANPQLVRLLENQEVYTRAACMEYECQQGDHTYLGFSHDTYYKSYKPANALRR